jgi:hypothetical protein
MPTIRSYLNVLGVELGFFDEVRFLEDHLMDLKQILASIGVFFVLFNGLDVATAA